MAARDLTSHLADMIEAIEVVRANNGKRDAASVPGADRDKRWLVERAVEIISEASRHLGYELRARHPDIPWRQVAGIGNVLRHEYARVAPEIIWAVAHEHMPELEKVCRAELQREQDQDRDH